MSTAPPVRVELKTDREVDLLRQVGRTATEILFELKQEIRPGMTTLEVDRRARRKLSERNVTSSFLNYRGYPATVCISVNEEVVHGIPGERVLQDGDLVSLDIGMFQNGFCGDTATSFVLGKATLEVERLMKAGRDSLDASIRAAAPGNRLGDVSHAMQSVVEKAGYTVVREYGGHGIGRAMHEEPHVPCFGEPGTGLRLREGMVLALEVMANAGTEKILHKPDGWTVVTADGGWSVHYEKMVAVTANGPELLTPHPEID